MRSIVSAFIYSFKSSACDDWCRAKDVQMQTGMCSLHVPAQAGRGSDIRLRTEASSRFGLQPDCWTFVSGLPSA